MRKEGGRLRRPRLLLLTGMGLDGMTAAGTSLPLPGRRPRLGLASGCLGLLRYIGRKGGLAWLVLRARSLLQWGRRSVARLKSLLTRRGFLCRGPRS